MKSQGKVTKKQTFPWLVMTKSHFFWLYLTFFFTDGHGWSNDLLEQHTINSDNNGTSIATNAQDIHTAIKIDW